MENRIRFYDNKLKKYVDKLENIDYTDYEFYLGFKDKTGQPVYEYDILKFKELMVSDDNIVIIAHISPYGLLHGIEYESTKPLSGDYRNIRFCLSDLIERTLCPRTFINKNIEIVGNIHDDQYKKYDRRISSF